MQTSHPAPEGDGAPEIEITPAMIAAGVQALSRYFGEGGPADYKLGPAAEAVIRAALKQQSLGQVS